MQLVTSFNDDTNDDAYDADNNVTCLTLHNSYDGRIVVVAENNISHDEVVIGHFEFSGLNNDLVFVKV